MTEALSVALDLTDRELMFLQGLTQHEDHFITEDEEVARMRLRSKLFHDRSSAGATGGALELTRDELLFLIKVARENYSFVERVEKEARLRLAGKLHRCAESVFGVVETD